MMMEVVITQNGRGLSGEELKKVLGNVATVIGLGFEPTGIEHKVNQYTLHPFRSDTVQANAYHLIRDESPIAEIRGIKEDEQVTKFTIAAGDTVNIPYVDGLKGVIDTYLRAVSERLKDEL